MDQFSGTYEGEGANIVATVPKPPAVNAATAGGTNAPQTAQTTADTANKARGRQTYVAVTRRRQARVSSESARDETPINVGGGDQVLSNVGRGVYISGSGNLVCRLEDASADSTFSNLAAGQVYPFAVAIIRQTGTTATGNVLF